MDRTKHFRWIVVIFISTFILIFMFTLKLPETWTQDWSIPKPGKTLTICPLHIATQTITPLNNTKHLLVTAYMDQRVSGYDIRIIGIFRIDSIQPLHCLFCCKSQFTSTTPAQILQHPEYFGFQFVTTDIMCQIPTNCSATHVTLIPDTRTETVSYPMWLPIRNQQTDRKGETKLQFNFTVCISTLFGGYNNVLQFAQTLEMYRLLGVGRVVIYNTSCGPDLDRLLQSYSQQGFVEMVPWPIDRHLNPSPGWLFSKHGGDMHYFGQMTTLNECIYRSMTRSRYVLLNDIDEIIIPYQHTNLMSLMNMLQQQHPNTGVFLIENHIFPKMYFEPSRKFNLPQWSGVPGINILEHIYKEEPDRNAYQPYKIILQPKMVEQTSVHEVIKYFGQQYKVPPDVCHIIHVRHPLRGLPLEQLHEDKRLWDFHEQLIPNVDRVLKRVGMLSSDGQS